MRHLYWILLTLWLLRMPTVGQLNPHTVLHDALVLENRGSFETAAKVAKAAIDSGQLSGNEQGRGYVILAVACQGAEDWANARIAFEHALQILEHDREHPEDYASALENYAAFYSGLGQLHIAVPMWRKASRLRQSLGDHTGTALSLTRLAEVALARNRVREAHRYLQKAANEAKASLDLIDDDRAFFLEIQGWLAIAEHHAPAAESGDHGRASANMQTGLTILDHALGQKNPKYLAAELAYSRVLDQFGLRAEAAQMRAAAGYYGSQCAGCTINVAGFR
jgi:tetratricopeptide (TPR) repeat protein